MDMYEMPPSCQVHSKLFMANYRNKLELLVFMLVVLHHMAPADVCSPNSPSLPILWPSPHCSLKRPVCNFRIQYFTCAFPLSDVFPPTSLMKVFSLLRDELKGPIPPEMCP